MTTSDHTTTGGTARLATLILLVQLASGLLGIAKDLIPVFLAATPSASTQAHPYNGTGTLGCMGDVDGLQGFGGLARWRDVLLRYPDGRAEPHRLVEVDGRLPYELRLPLNEARTAYDRFVLSSLEVRVPVYDWADVEER